MNRHVDVKALVSHIVRGDGLDKCRICMGDTSQGQVHLGDTVMMDGDKPVTLSELLEVITGVEVVIEEAVPSAVCLTCSTSAIEAAGFRTLVQNADHQWTNMLCHLECIPDYKYSKTSDRICAVLNKNNIYIYNECSNKPLDTIRINEIEDDLNFPIKRVGKQLDCHCPKCGKKFLYTQHLYRHLKDSADLLRSCHVCADIMDRDVLVVHLTEKHNTSPFSCKRCPALFLNGKEYKKHLLIAHAPGACTCGDCGRTFRSKPAFHAHQSVHTLRSCPNCDTRFRNQPCYSFHVRKCCNMDPKNAKKSKITVTLHKKQNQKLKMGLRGSANKECICDYCNKKFAAKRFVAAHIQIVHTKDTHTPCIHCGKLFAAAHMTTHIKSHTQQSFECHECGVILKSKLGFVQHLRLHTGEKPYTCEFCGKSFSASSRRSEHIRSIHKKSEIVLKHACKRCPASFRRPHELRCHIKSVHKDGADESWYTSASKNMESTYSLPKRVCQACLTSVMDFLPFLNLCRESSHKWNQIVDHLDNISFHKKSTTAYVILGDEPKTVTDRSKRGKTRKEAITYMKTQLSCIRYQNKIKQKRAVSKDDEESKKFSCPKCKKSYRLLFKFKKHIRNINKDCCEICQSIVDIQSYGKHLKTHSIESFKCNVCHLYFKTKTRLLSHEAIHKKGKFTCPDCMKTFPAMDRLTLHASSQHITVHCACNQVFTYRGCYVYHKKTCELAKQNKVSSQKVICDYCSKEFDKSTLTLHIKYKHSNKNWDYQCDQCGKQFFSTHALLEHSNTHDKVLDRYTCQFCGLNYSTNRGIRRHLTKKHYKVNPELYQTARYQCHICEKILISPGNLKRHLETKHKT